MRHFITGFKVVLSTVYKITIFLYFLHFSLT